MIEKLEEKAAKTKELIAWMIFGKPMNFYFLGKNAQSGLYTLDGKIVEAVPVGGIRITKISLDNEEVKREIRGAMTKSRLNEPGFNANAVYIRRKNGVMKYYNGGDITQYQPLRIEHL